MKYVKNLVIVLILSLFLIFAGCSAETGDASQSGLFGKGTSTKSSGSGVSLTFAEGNPTKDMIKGEPTTFAFIFTNSQEHEITDLRVKTKGFDKSYVKNLQEDYTVSSIPRASEQVGPGVYSGLVESGVVVDGFTGSYSFNPKFDYCYSAKTSFREQKCVPSTKNQCNTQVETSKKENGPLSVTIERIVSTESEVRIDFVINNKGNGRVVNECFKTEDYANKYDLKVSLGSAAGSCEAISGQNIINGASKFYCKFARTSEDSYASQVVVEVDYLYQQTTEKKITVKDLNQGYQ